MKRYVLTGAPGSGKTILIRALEIVGCRVVEEAATSLITLEQAQGKDQPWEEPGFLDRVLALQRQRMAQCDLADGGLQFHDRSPICTLALAKFLGRSPSQGLMEEIHRVTRDGIFSNSVFFIENLGFSHRTEARRISFEEVLRFEQIRRETYRELGFDLFCVPPDQSMTAQGRFWATCRFEILGPQGPPLAIKDLGGFGHLALQVHPFPGCQWTPAHYRMV
jgi:predicted ATPase